MSSYEQLAADAVAEIDGAGDLDSLEALRPTLLGKKAPISAAKKDLGSLEPDQRKEAGQAINAARQTVEAAFAARHADLASAARAIALEAERLDLTEFQAKSDAGHLHLITQARDRLEDVFVGMGYTVAEGPEVETAWYNFEALNIPEWHPCSGQLRHHLREPG